MGLVVVAAEVDVEECVADCDFVRAWVCERVTGFEVELAVVIVLAVGLARPDDPDDICDVGRSVVAAVRLVTVDFDLECPIRRLEEAVVGGPPEDLGLLVVALVVRPIEASGPVAAVEGG